MMRLSTCRWWVQLSLSESADAYLEPGEPIAMPRDRAMSIQPRSPVVLHVMNPNEIDPLLTPLEDRLAQLRLTRVKLEWEYGQ